MELNREQIKKDLEYCSSGGQCFNCAENDKNPFLSKEGCMAVQMRNALALIKELTEENERLKAENDELCDDMFCLDRENELIIANTVRSMRSRIKARCIAGGIYPAFVENVIDQIAKEMLEGITDDKT